jgi:hypothetical protein
VLAAIVALACAVALVAVLASDTLVVQAATVSGARHTAGERAIAASGVVGSRAFLASATEARARLRALPAVRDASVEIDLLGPARLALVEREAAGRWVVGGVEWFVDVEGVLFDSRDPTAAPALRVTDGRGARRAGERLDPALVAAALRLAQLRPGELRADMLAPSVHVDAGPSGLVLRSGARWEVRFGSADRFDEKLATARAFLEKERDRPLDYVDVRSPSALVFAPQ